MDENDKESISNADFLGTTYKSIFEGFYFPSGLDIGIDKDTLRWSSFIRMPAEEMFTLVQTRVFPFIKQLDNENSYFTKHMQNAASLECL